jgi:hypothetical protein
MFFLVLYLDVFLKLSWCFLDRLVVTPASKEVISTLEVCISLSSMDFVFLGDLCHRKYSV